MTDPSSSPAFSSLALSPELLRNLDDLGYHAMTPIQAESLPAILAGRDVLARAKTGSGKTAAFGIGLVSSLNVGDYAVQALVLCPTRELADQVARELRRLARAIHNIKVLTLCGGVGIGPQLASLERGAHIIVGTPGRITDHLRKGSLQLSALRQLVLDEADRMLDMGFAEDLATVVAACPRQRQTLLFSATYPDTIRALSADYLRDPVSITVESLHSAQQITQVFYALPEGSDKTRAATVLALLHHHRPEASVVFCNTKQSCDQLMAFLNAAGVDALALHGDMEQRTRDEVLVRFANGSCRVLIATDVAARGLDIKGLDAVINYDLVRDQAVHVHRIGRTGRAGAEGLALSLVAPEDQIRFERLQVYLDAHFPLANLPPQNAGEQLPVPDMVTLEIDGGRKHKLRPGDILGALTKDAGLPGDSIGKISSFDFRTYVAVRHNHAKAALRHLENGKLKGKRFRVRRVR